MASKKTTSKVTSACFGAVYFFKDVFIGQVNVKNEEQQSSILHWAGTNLAVNTVISRFEAPRLLEHLLAFQGTNSLSLTLF